MTMQNTLAAANTCTLLPTGKFSLTASSPHYLKGHSFIERQV